MRKNIVDTTVILNAAICPGIILIPSSLIILKKKIPGFNNILTMADYWMKFRENKTVNKVVVPPSPPTPVEKKSPVKPKPPVKKNDTPNTSKPFNNPFYHSSYPNLEGFVGQNTTRNFQQTNQKSDVGGTGGDTARHQRHSMVL